MIHTTFTRASSAGDLIRGDVRIAEGPPPRSAIVVMHGFKGFKDWGFFPHACESLAAAGHAVVSFNASHNGVGADLQSFSELERFGKNTLSKELDELLLIVREVIDGELLPRRPDRVGLLGHSRGGGQVLLAAREEPRVRAVATWAAVSHFDRWDEETKGEWRADGRIWILNSRTGQQMPLDVGFLQDYERNRDRLDVTAAASELDRPLLVVHGVEDLTVRAQEGRALAGAASEARLVLVDGAGHTFEAKHPFGGSTPQLDRALQATVSHFRKHLQG